MALIAHLIIISPSLLPSVSLYTYFLTAERKSFRGAPEVPQRLTVASGVLHHSHALCPETAALSVDGACAEQWLLLVGRRSLRSGSRDSRPCQPYGIWVKDCKQQW